MCLTFFPYELLMIWEILNELKEQNLAIMVLAGQPQLL